MTALIIMLSICLTIFIVSIIIAISEEETIFLIPGFISGILSGIFVLLISTISKDSTNKEKPTREVDYSIILIPFDKVEITDKHGNRDTIQFESLQHFIEQDNK